MMDYIVAVFGSKQIFTYVILTLYAANCAFQILVTKDYIWAGYWASAASITVFAMTLSQR